MPVGGRSPLVLIAQRRKQIANAGLPARKPIAAFRSGREQIDHPQVFKVLSCVIRREKLHQANMIPKAVPPRAVPVRAN